MKPEWGKSSHRLIASLAQKHITSNTSKALAYYLSEWDGNLAEVAAWADEIKNHKNWSHTSRFHYVQIADGECDFVRERDCNNGCVVSAIESFVQVVKEREKYPFEAVRDAIRFIVHFVADVMQPLHVAWKNTLGGNLIEVKFFGLDTNLHVVWDRLIPERRIEEKSKTQQKFIKYLHNKLSSRWKEKAQNWLRCPEEDKVLCPELWALESARFSCSVCFRDVIPGEELGLDYYEKSFPILEVRIAQAAVRLAGILNWLFDGIYDIFLQ